MQDHPKHVTGGNHPPGMPHGLGPAPPGAFKGGDLPHGPMPPHGSMQPHGSMPPMGPRPPLPFSDDGPGGPHGGGGPHRRMLRGISDQDES